MSQSRGRTYAKRSDKKKQFDALKRTALGASTSSKRNQAMDRIMSLSTSRPPKEFFSKGPGKGTWSETVNQRDQSSSKTTLGRKTTAAQTALKLTRSQLETVLLRWNGVRPFDTRGYYWMTNRVVTAGRRDLPLYMFDLTALSQNGGISPSPLVQLTQITATGVMAFDIKSGDGTGGAGALTSTLEVERAPSAVVPFVAASKTMLKSANIKLNCWGAKSKATQYTIQLVKFLDDELVPNHDGAAAVTGQTSKRTDFYQDLVKPLVFNPISKTGGAFRNRMKVLRTESFIVQPNSADDGDTDPQVKTVSMFVAMNKIISYTEKAVVIASDVNLADDSDYAVNGATQYLPQPRPKNRLYLMVRASNYKVDAAETNTDTPSFDLSIRLNHQVTV